jgi:hypothetical protein
MNSPFLAAYTEAIVAQVLESLGMTAGEISQRQARKTYGKYFDLLVRQGRIRPSRIEEGHAGTIYYRVADILAAKAEDRAPAELLTL